MTVSVKRPFRLLTLIVALAALSTGCKALLIALNDDKLKKVTAECDKLAGKRVAVVVWAEHSTLDVDPFACDRTAKAIQFYFRQNAGKPQLKGMKLIDPQHVTEFQEQVGNTGPSLADGEVARRLNADAILRCDLYEYTTRAPEANGLVMARISGNLILNMAGEAEPVYRSEATAAFPENSKIGVMDRSDEDVLIQTRNMFGERIARKFYDHEEAYK